MNLFKAIEMLKSKKLPIPIKCCENCQTTIYKKDYWFKCSDCETLRTVYGGFCHTEFFTSSLY